MGNGARIMPIDEKIGGLRWREDKPWAEELDWWFEAQANRGRS